MASFLTRLALSHVRAAPDSKPRLRGERAQMFADRAGLEDLTAKALASTAVAELRVEMAGRNGLVHDERPGPVGALTWAS